MKVSFQKMHRVFCLFPTGKSISGEKGISLRLLLPASKKKTDARFLLIGKPGVRTGTKGSEN